MSTIRELCSEDPNHKHIINMWRVDDYVEENCGLYLLGFVNDRTRLNMDLTVDLNDMLHLETSLKKLIK